MTVQMRVAGWDCWICLLKLVVRRLVLIFGRCIDDGGGDNAREGSRGLQRTVIGIRGRHDVYMQGFLDAVVKVYKGTRARKKKKKKKGKRDGEIFFSCRLFVSLILQIRTPRYASLVCKDGCTFSGKKEQKKTKTNKNEEKEKKKNSNNNQVHHRGTSNRMDGMHIRNTPFSLLYADLLNVSAAYLWTQSQEENVVAVVVVLDVVVVDTTTRTFSSMWMW